jgi:ribosomal protein S18 acetylase RimI-like enzyme
MLYRQATAVDHAALAAMNQRLIWRGQRLRVEVLAGNAGAIAFWRAVGFGEYSLTLEKESATGSQAAKLQPA